jgi:SOS-response transcriptional repressor LexA
VNGKIIVASVPETEITLKELLSGINEHNLHRDDPVASDAELEEC